MRHWRSTCFRGITLHRIAASGYSVSTRSQISASGRQARPGHTYIPPLHRQRWIQRHTTSTMPLPFPEPNALHEVHQLDTLVFEKNVDIPLKDGQGLLRGNVYRPKEDSKYPVILTCKSPSSTVAFKRSPAARQTDRTGKTSPTPTFTVPHSKRSPRNRNPSSRHGRHLNRRIGRNTATSSFVSMSVASGPVMGSWIR